MSRRGGNSSNIPVSTKHAGITMFDAWNMNDRTDLHGSRHFSLFDFKNIFQYVHMFEQLNLKLGEKFQWIQRHKK